MEYSFFVGILPNFNLSFSGWIFTVAALLLMLVGLSSLLYVHIRTKTLPIKIGLFIGFVFSGLIVFGVVGSVFFALSYFASYSFITEFTKDF